MKKFSHSSQLKIRLSLLIRPQNQSYPKESSIKTLFFLVYRSQISIARRSWRGFRRRNERLWDYSTRLDFCGDGPPCIFNSTHGIGYRCHWPYSWCVPSRPAVSNTIFPRLILSQCHRTTANSRYFKSIAYPLFWNNEEYSFRQLDYSWRKNFMLDNVLDIGEEQGLILFEKYLSKLYKAGQITKETAMEHAIRKNLIENLFYKSWTIGIKPQER